MSNVTLKQITEAAVSPQEIDQFLFTNTRTKSDINVTAVNALSLALAANSVNLNKVNVLRSKLMTDNFKSADERTAVIEAIESEELAARTFSFTQLADFIVNRLNIVACYHKKDNKKIAERLADFTKAEILNDDSLKAACVKITALRLRNHTSHHIFQTKRYLDYFSMELTNSESFTVKERSLQLIMNTQVRGHVKALTNELKKIHVVKKAQKKTRK
jgi:hypothetical protein